MKGGGMYFSKGLHRDSLKERKRREGYASVDGRRMAETRSGSGRSPTSAVGEAEAPKHHGLEGTRP